MKLSKILLFITALCCAAPTLVIQNSTSSSENKKWQWKIHKTFEKFILLVAALGMEAYMERIHGERCDFGYANGN